MFPTTFSIVTIIFPVSLFLSVILSGLCNYSIPIMAFDSHCDDREPHYVRTITLLGKWIQWDLELLTTVEQVNRSELIQMLLVIYVYGYRVKPQMLLQHRWVQREMYGCSTVLGAVCLIWDMALVTRLEGSAVRGCPCEAIGQSSNWRCLSVIISLGFRKEK